MRIRIIALLIASAIAFILILPPSFKYNAEDDNSYNKTLKNWKSELSEKTTDFSQSTQTLTPGDVVNCSENPAADFPFSALSDKTNLKFYYEGKTYAYGIDKSGNEIIALKRENGTKIDTLKGGGNFYFCSASKNVLLKNTTVSTFEEIRNNYKTESVTVTYLLEGTQSADSSVTATYTFNRNSIGVTYHAICNSSETIAASKSGFSRVYANKCTDEARVSKKWVYPDDMSDPYQEFDALNFIDTFGDSFKMYTSIRDERLPHYYCLPERKGSSLPLSLTDTTNLDYSYSYDISMVDASSVEQTPDYLGLFMCRNSQFAAGIATLGNTIGKSSLFVGTSAELNINLTNLSDEDITYSLRYDIRDCDGNVADCGLFADNTLSESIDSNRSVSVSGKYGIYYLNLYIISQKGNYTECYPFAILSDYNYRYNASSPFGTSSVKGDTDEQMRNNAIISAGIGIANGRSTGIAYMQKMNELGINRFNGQINLTEETEEGVPKFIERVAASIQTLSPYVQSFEVGNEMNIQTLRTGGPDVDSLYDKFYSYTFLPSYSYIKENYPNIDYIPTSFSAAETSWIKRLATGENSIWDKFNICSVHTYGTPWMPDAYGSQSGKAGDLWNIESAMIRISDAMKTYGNKEIYVSETGYATPENGIGLRTQADYIVRIGAICLGYGADRIQYYCFNDRTGYFSGVSKNDGEFNFGQFYEPNFYNVVLPKPSGVAFAVMSRQLESVKHDGGSIDAKYDEGFENGGVRAFRFDTDLYGDVIVAYSNKEILTEAKKNSRGTTSASTPNLPWNSQWHKTDDTVFEALGNSVKVVDFMGNEKFYTSEDGKVTIPLTGSPVYIYGVK